QGDVATATDDEWRRVLDINVVGMARVTRAALPYLRQSSHASVVCVSSVVAVVGVPNRAVYAASKGAVLALALAMA
ncbi:SDR family NAD(P)-dependent oxidoreductase, partial [Acinetobacter sp. LH3_13]|uniref:SDR family NAD(P)-dependent oxidoreductase n=1 Tax=Acinetobacter sp. LH3_13 TaxID=3434463 RepID=UPI003EBC4ED9